MANKYGSDWKYRRRYMYVVSAFCMWTIAYVLFKDRTSGPADTAITMAFVTLIGIVGSYVFGATWETVSVAKSKLARPRADKPAPGNGASADVGDLP
jgi:hypothetical protein